jgi:hypothetical protein
MFDAGLTATRLVESDPNDCSMDVVAALVEWLHGRTPVEPSA